MLSSPQFEAFLTHHGALCALNAQIVPKADAHGGIGMFATTRINVGDVLADVPRCYLLTLQDIAHDKKIGRLIMSSVRRAPSAFAVYIAFYSANPTELDDTRQKSFFAILPRSYDTLPFWSPEELSLLDDPILLTRAKEKTEELRLEYSEILKNLQKHFGTKGADFLQPADWLTWSSYLLGLGVVDTRAIFFSSAKPLLEDDIYALMPFADFINHSPKSLSAGRYSDISNSFRIEAKEVYNAGDEVYISYGKHSNAVLLEYYGFVVDGNQFDVLYPTKSALERLCVKEFQREILNSLGLSEVKNIYFSNDDNPIPWDTLTCARVLCLTESDHEGWQTLLEDRPVSLTNEKAAITLLQSLIPQLAATEDQNNPRSALAHSYSLTRIAIVEKTRQYLVRLRRDLSKD